jgi:hypothetical protein
MRTKVIFILTITVTLGLVLIASNREWFMSSPNAFIYFFTGVIVVVVATAIGLTRRDRGRRGNIPSGQVPENREERRRFERIQHRLNARPTLTIDGETYEVRDISEQGVRFANPENRAFQKWVHGRLLFSDGADLEIDGVIVRKQPGEIGLQLITTIPGDVIARESRFRLSPPR